MKIQISQIRLGDTLLIGGVSRSIRGIEYGKLSHRLVTVTAIGENEDVAEVGVFSLSDVVEIEDRPETETEMLKQRLAEAEQVIRDGLDYKDNPWSSRLLYEECIAQARAYWAKYHPQEAKPE